MPRRDNCDFWLGLDTGLKGSIKVEGYLFFTIFAPLKK
jgi:hypothetical protein